VTIGLLPTLLGCASARRPVLEVWDQHLRATLRVEEGTAIIGEHFDVTFALLNTGSTTLEACFGESFQVTFWNGREAQGWADTVDHPPCAQRFVLPPGEEVSRVYTAQIPSISEGLAELGGGVQVVDPTHCDRYGCDTTWVKSATHPKILVKRAGG